MENRIERIKLFHHPASRSARVKWMLHEVLDDDFDVETVDLYEAPQYDDAFRARNPNHAVPTLELTLTDGSKRHMIESGAMLEWLADAFPQHGLAPRAGELSAERADYLQMLHFGSTWMDMMLWQVRIHEHVLDDDQRDERTRVRYRNKFTREVEPQLQARLTKHPFICGDRFQAADIMVGHNVLWARLYGLCQGDVFAEYAKQLMQRPACMKAFADVGQFVPEVAKDKPLRQHFTG